MAKSHLDVQTYDHKIRDFREMLKVSIYSKQDLVDHLDLIETWLKFKGLEITLLDQSFLNQNLVLSIASELQPFYQQLWLIKSISDLVENYQHLSPLVKEIYDIDEIINDWENRQYAIQRYTAMIHHLETEYYFIDELEERLDTYMHLQIFYSDQKIHFLHLSDLITQYQDRILVRDQHCVKGINFHMIKCPKGAFWMGYDLGEEDEKPKHQVILNQSFWVGETQVTQALWNQVMGWNHSHFQESMNLPVENITWYDCLKFCNLLSILQNFEPCFILNNLEKDGDHITRADVEWKKEANGYRLPTEAEWEYIAKANQETYYGGSNQIDEVAWYQNNANGQTHEVKGKKANRWSLFDLSGNVKEWCMDEYDEDIYLKRSHECQINPVLWRNQPIENVLRGGSYLNDEELCLLRHRDSVPPCYLSAHLGLRLLRCEIFNL